MEGSANIFEGHQEGGLDARKASDWTLMTNRHEFFRRVLKIRNKAGYTVPFVMNREQRHVDEILDRQLSQTGRVRALILKGRKQGMSTYVGGRYYHPAAILGNVSIFIMSHRAQTTGVLFAIPKRFYRNSPDEYRPFMGSSDATQIKFPVLDSGYEVGTAGAVAIGRGDTIQLFHGSEVAFWPNAGEHAAGMLEAIPESDGTEIILESTANGVGGYFYEQWQNAIAGRSDYIAIFIPWFWSEDYKRDAPADFLLTDEEIELADLYDLDDRQIYWRRQKIVSLGSEWKFKQEYPCNAEEAFQMSGLNVLIRSEDVMRARKNTLEIDSYAPLVMGVDCAANLGGGDATRMLSRQGRVMGRTVNRRMYTDDTMEIAGVVARDITEKKIKITFIDVGGLGKGVIDRLRERKFGKFITAVNFGGKAHDKSRCFNKRSEMWNDLNEWLKDEGGCDVPDDDTLHVHFCSALLKTDSLSRVRLVEKDIIRAKFGFSPDDGDAAALTFAEMVAPDDPGAVHAWLSGKREKRGWMAS